jgi:glyoxylase-like metal-dependent hydrolase (beta-lactamase superfamily II)
MPPFYDYEFEICCIDTEQLRPGLAGAYLVRGGDEYAFVDCGTSRSVPGLLQVLAHKGIAVEQVAYVLPTHVHLDHAGGAGALLRALPRAKLIAHPRAARHLIDPSRLIEGAAAVYGAHNLAKMYGEILPVPEARVSVADDGFKLRLGGRELVFYDAPGHARHHYVVWDARSRGIFSGDVLGISYREFDGPEGPYLFPTTTPVQFEPQAWVTTLDRLLALDPAWVYLTHFGRLGDVPRLARELKRGLEAYQRIARRHAEAPDRHARIRAELTEHALHELAALDCPLSVAQAQRLLEFDMELNAQGLEVWLERQAKAGHGAHG